MTAPDPTDERLQALGARARARLRAQDEAWAAVSRGERSEDEVATERREAGDSPEAIERAQALYRPLDPSEQGALVEALLAGIEGTEPPEQAEPEPEPAEPEQAEPEQAEPSTRTIPAAANDSGPWWWVAVAVAAAVIVGWWLVARPPPSRPEPEDRIAAVELPEYRLETDGGLRDQRGDEGPTTLRYRVQTPLTWTVRPATEVSGELTARVFAYGEGEPRLLSLGDALQVRDGTARIVGPASVLGLPPGAWTIEIVVGRPSALPDTPAESPRSTGADGFIVKTVSLVIEP